MESKTPKVGDVVYVWSVEKGYQVMECQITAIYQIHSMSSAKTQYVLEDKHGEYVGCYCGAALRATEQMAYDDMIKTLKETILDIKGEIMNLVSTLADYQKDLDNTELRLRDAIVRRSQLNKN